MSQLIIMRGAVPTLLACLTFSGLTLSGALRSARGQVRESAVVTSANNVLSEFVRIPNQGIPRSLLARAEGLVIIPRMIKVGLVAGGRRGKGIVVTRNAQRAWTPPLFATMTGGSVGWQAGIQSTDVILVFMTRRSIQGLLSGKLTVGVDAAAAAGPVGRQAAAATDARLQAEILSYSRSRGLFAGVSVDGSVLQIDAGANQAYYRSAGMTPDGTPLSPNAQLPPSAAQLLSQLAVLTSAAVAAPALPPGQPVAGTNSILPHGAAAQPATGLSGSAAVGSGPAAPPAPGPLDLGPPPTTTPSDIETTRQNLVAAAQQMGLLLDNSWRLYLALPEQVFSGRALPPADKLDLVIGRFDRVTRDSRYQPLTDRREFQQLYQLLQVYRQQVRQMVASGR